jgi:type I restriction enzyme M protein
VATCDEITANDFNLNIPRYVDRFEEEEDINIKDAQIQIDRIDKELANIQEKTRIYLEELGL